jgi:hypothetical protein
MDNETFNLLKGLNEPPPMPKDYTGLDRPTGIIDWAGT